ncbi:fumarylacetoacetate hydrolase family protein [Pseudaestuariivita atlantica]|uniref:Fumarylacetoacetase n=1 Tax=Pseudaestuariivita atlantica TaxID=1317121 RepID=A0A0L1JPF9_9RHOB|nr:fumarylacetoacetate hydrolase family protein [Pseudaestuariivita atlantica]KNG93293.1 fumarylacetoacetase [Pseudaestuariivita atlantica]
MTHLFDPAPVFALPVTGEDATYPVNRIFCVGRNYAAHAAEMGATVDREAPFYFTKTPVHAVQSGATLPYPPATDDYHHEMEFTFALSAPLFRATRDEAEAAIFGYGTGLDMTRRDLQAKAKETRRPWDISKDAEGAVVLSGLTRKDAAGPLAGKAIRLTVNGEVRQDATLDDMIHDVTDILVHLSTLYHLAPGDLVMTGTPAGVAAVVEGDVLHGTVDGLQPVDLTLTARE